MKLIFAIALLGLIVACGAETEPDSEALTSDETVLDDTTSTDSLLETNELTFDPALAELPETFPSSIFQAELMQESTFHEGEIPENAESMEWWGIFNIGGEQFSLERAAVNIKTVYDPMLDEEGEMSGVEVTTTNEGEPVILISGLNTLESRTLNEVSLENKEFFPETPVQFDYENDSYRLFSTAIKDEHGFYMDYHLYFEITENEGVRTQEIARAAHFDDAMMYAMFIGDIDGDGIVDLLIETTPKYSMSAPTLFLSTAAEEGQIVGRVGVIATTGC